MNKFVLATFAALLLGTAAFAQPAEARCWWNGYSWHCWHSHGWWGTIIHIGAIMDMAMALTGITTGTVSLISAQGWSTAVPAVVPAILPNTEPETRPVPPG